MAVDPRIVMIEFIETIAARGEGKTWTVNNLGRRAARFAWRIAYQHHAENRDEILEGAKQMVANRTDEVRKHIRTKLSHSEWCRIIGSSGGGATVLGGLLLFTPLAPVGVGLVTAGSVTSVGSDITRSQMAKVDGKEIIKASQQLFEPDENNHLLMALHEIADLQNEPLVYDADQPNVLKMQNYILCVDTLFSYYHNDPTRIPKTESEAIATLQTIIDGVVQHFRKGFASDLSEAVQCMLAARDSGKTIEQMQEVKKVREGLQLLMSTQAGVGCALVGLSMVWAGKQGMAMVKNVKMIVKESTWLGGCVKQFAVNHRKAFANGGPVLAILGGALTITNNVLGMREDRRESQEAMEKAEDAKTRMDSVLTALSELHEPKDL